MVDPLLGLLLLWAVSRGSKASAPGGGSLFPSPRPGRPADKGGGGASTFPVTPPAPSVPPRSSTPPAKWKPYPSPIPAAVVARANELLRDKSMALNAERLEPDPAGSGPIRYWKVNQPPGKVSVTVWRPNLAQADRPAGNAPPSPRVLRSALSTKRAPSPGRLARGGLARGAGGGPA